MPKLVVLSPGLNGLSFEVPTEKASVGRLEDNRLCIAEPSVSSHHCEIWLKGDDIVVKDTNSTNGTYVNEVQVAAEKEALVRPGQILRLGQIELRHETGKKQSEQPLIRHSNPASRKMRSSPSASAARRTAIDPGTTIACTLGAT